ncbi:hypothetical protein H6G06_16860 [Anabaena sphaerica FACHB-251]|uniref:Uncharacterized protein n=1 Tax=Anabaena sphaerica FACHB-251 TaxID=2692883 RepID=A0A926WJ57_9NOST|nr:hypothetical protein [Anabaena sphaerica]MBD2295105.1 hypothetical protein [Anabaena sphaerica FACHB-251]
MKLSRIMPLVVGGAVAGVVVSSASPAQALDFNFSFTNDPGLGSVNGTVEGTIYGLIDNATSSATGIIVTSYPAGLNLPATPFSPFSLGNETSNSFEVLNGVLVNANLRIIGSNFQFSLNDSEGVNGLVGISSSTYNNGGFAGATYTSAAVPFDIPGGATIPTVGSLFALGLMRKVKKRMALKSTSTVVS